jgi:hypothetical protein
MFKGYGSTAIPRFDGMELVGEEFPDVVHLFAEHLQFISDTQVQ